MQAIVIVTSGFGETGTREKELEQELVRIARKGGAYYWAELRWHLLPFIEATLLPGIRQREWFGGCCLPKRLFCRFPDPDGHGQWFRQLSKAISCGNDADLNAIDFLEYLGEDPQTETILLTSKE